MSPVITLLRYHDGPPEKFCLPGCGGREVTKRGTARTLPCKNVKLCPSIMLVRCRWPACRRSCRRLHRRRRRRGREMVSSRESRRDDPRRRAISSSRSHHAHRSKLRRPGRRGGLLRFRARPGLEQRFRRSSGSSSRGLGGWRRSVGSVPRRCWRRAQLGLRGAADDVPTLGVPMSTKTREKQLKALLCFSHVGHHFQRRVQLAGGRGILWRPPAQLIYRTEAFYAKNTTSSRSV